VITLSVGALAELGESTAALTAAGFAARVPAIEILWDNYCSLDPVRLADDLATVADRVMLHVMWSRYLDLDSAELDDYLARLRRHVDALRPLAVSDHLCRFQLDARSSAPGKSGPTTTSITSAIASRAIKTPSARRCSSRTPHRPSIPRTCRSSLSKP